MDLISPTGGCSQNEPDTMTRILSIGSPDSAAELAREISPTDDGQAVRKGHLDWIRLRGGIDRWYGGVHLTGTEPEWRWDRKNELLVQSS